MSARAASGLGDLREILRTGRLGLPAIRPLIGATAAGAASELASLALIATATWLIVRAAAQPPITALALAIVGVRAFALARGAFRYLERLAGHDAALAALAALRTRVFSALAPLGPAALGRLRGGEALSNLVADVDAIGDLLVRCLMPAAVAGVTAGAVVTLGTLLDPGAGAVVAGGLLLAIVVVPAASYWNHSRTLCPTARARARLATRSLDLIDGAAELAAYGAAPAALAAADAAADQLARRERAVTRTETSATAALVLLQAATTLAVTVLAAGATTRGLAPIVVPVLVLTCLTAFEATMPLPRAARHLVEAAASGHRLAELLRATPEVAEPANPHTLDPRRPVTGELHDVVVRYAADRPAALRGISMRMPLRRRIAVVGPSGSGKSTLLTALARSVDIEAGTYTLAGHDVKTLTTDEVRAHVSGATQNAYVFHATLRDNLALARPDATDAELLEAADRARLTNWITTLPYGLDTVVGHDGATISGGQRQRLVLARALLADPDILLLDEPVEGLDPPTAVAVLAEILDATRGRTTVLVTHTLRGLAAVDEILVLDAGRVVQRGTHTELIAVPGLYRELWRAEQLSVGLTGATAPRPVAL